MGHFAQRSTVKLLIAIGLWLPGAAPALADNQPPYVASSIAPVAMNEDDDVLGIDLTGVFDDPDIAAGDSLSITVIATSNPGLFDDVSMDATFPERLIVQLAADAFGSSSITVQATDLAGASVTYDVLIQVAELSPAAVDDSATMQEDDAAGFITIDVLANDTLGDLPATIVSVGRSWTDPFTGQTYVGVSNSEPTTQKDETGTDVTLPNATMSVVSGKVNYLPKPNYSGVDTFDYTMQDADGHTSSAIVTVTVVDEADAPRVYATPSYSVVQQSTLDVLADGGLLTYAVDDDGDALEVRLLSVPGHVQAPLEANFEVNADGSFRYTPDPAYGDDPGEDVDTFMVIMWDESDGLASEPVEVVISIDALNTDSDAPPSGQVQFGHDLADVPLESAISAEANVLVVMDDSGSMDWSVMTPEMGGEFSLNNSLVKEEHLPSFSRAFLYVYKLATNIYQGSRIVPTEETLAADSDFDGNDYGVWRARNPRYNTVYYDHEVRYIPWAGLDRDGVVFEDAQWPIGVLDPFDVSVQTIDLSLHHTFMSRRVPVTRGNWAQGHKGVTNVDVYFPYYYRTTAAAGAVPGPDEMGTKVVIDGVFPITLENGTQINYYPGGPDRRDCADGDDDPLICTFAQERQNFVNWFTYYRSREYTAKGALGQAVANATSMRVGYAAMNNANEREHIDSLNGSFRTGHKKELMDQIYQTTSDDITPLRGVLDRAGRHFECVAGDVFGSTAASEPGDAACPVLAAPDGQCQNNFTLLTSDGVWNGEFTTEDHDSEVGPGSSAFDGGMFGDNRESTLADIAMHYYERDLHGLADGVPTTQRDRDWAPLSAFGSQGELMHQHMKTFTVGFGVDGSISFSDLPVGDGNAATGYTTPFAWGDPFNGGVDKIDDMFHAAVNGRGEFLQANNPVLLSQAFRNAFEQFAEGSMSVSAVAFNSTSLREETMEYRGFFNLRSNSGDLRALRVDPNDGVVDILDPVWSAAQAMDDTAAEDRVIVTFNDDAGYGTLFEYDALAADQQATLTEGELEWLRGVRQDEEPAGTLRSRDSQEGLLGDIVHSSPQLVGAPRAIRRDQAPYPTASSDLYSRFVSDNASRRRVVYVGANDGMLHGFDAGDDQSDSGDGSELIAYVPNKVIDDSQRFSNRLNQLMSPAYSHRFFVDLTPTIEDVFMKASAVATSRSWNSVLVGGLGGGGKGYFALNVTDPSRFTTALAPDTVLWEFTDDDDTYPVDSDGDPLLDADGSLLVDLTGEPAKDLGYALNQARIAMSNAETDGGDKEWVAVFGNGYNSTAGIAKLFVLFVERGLDGWSEGDFVKLSTDEGVRLAPDALAGLPNGLGEPALLDVDANGTLDRAYAGDQFGNLYRFDIADTNPDNWSVTKLFQATYDGTLSTRQPITKQPLVVKHPTESGFMLVFGTGSYLTEADGTDTEIQSLYGIWERDEVAPATADPAAKLSRLVEQNIMNIVDESNTNFPRQRVIEASEVVYTPDAGSEGTYGWYIDLDAVRATTTLSGNPNSDDSGRAPPDPQYPGERAVRRILARGDALIMTTVIPRDANTCFRAPPGSSFPIDPLTGGSPKRPIFDVNNDGIIDDADLISLNGGEYAAGIVLDTDDLDGTLVDPSLLIGNGDSDFLFLSGGDDQLSIRISGSGDDKVGRLSWLELINAN